MNKKSIPLLKYLQILFYLAFLFLWFKDNFSPLREIHISFLWALVPLGIITLIRILIALKKRKLTYTPAFRPEVRIILVLIILAVLFRIPFLAHIQGFNDGDDGLIIMQAKHIYDGERPSVYNYGLVYESSTLMHVYALLFKVFGYSILIPRLISLTIFIAFIIMQFCFLQDVFSREFALFGSLFYCLPVGHTMITSLNLSGDFPSILLLGSLSVYLSYLINLKNRADLIPFLGFFMGLAFWVHQMTASFLLTSLIIFAWKYKLQIKKYIQLSVYGIIGAFPVVMSEVVTDFSLVKFLLSSNRRGMDFGSQIKRSLEIFSYLLTRHLDFMSYFFLGLFFLSLSGLLIAVIRYKKNIPYGIFVIFFVVFFLVYFLSKFSAKTILSVRYFYPLYFALPVILFASMLIMKTKVKYFFAALLLLLLCVSHNLSDYYSDINLVKQAHKNLKHTIAALEETGEKYWTGDFWDSFLVTTLSGEKVISYHHTNPKYYPPYFFFYFNQGRNNNFLFLKQAGMYALAYREMLDDISSNQDRKLERGRNLMLLLDRFGIEYKKKRVDGSLFVFDIQEDVPPTIMNFLIPEEIPVFKLAEVKYENMHSFMTFKIETTPKFPGFRLNAEIPGYSSATRGFSPEKEEVTIRLPFPREESFNLRYYLDYKSIRISSSIREVILTPPPNDLLGKKPRITYLSGFGPFVEIFGKKQRICEREAKLEIVIPKTREVRVYLHLASPFDFSHPMWRGKHVQKLEVKINGLSRVESTLEYGKNVIELDLPLPAQKGESNIIELRFKYHLPLKGTSVWKTAALLEKIEFE